MDNNLMVVLGVIGAALLGMLVYLTGQDPLVKVIDVPTFPLASMASLETYPEGVGEDDLYAVRLPQNDLVVVLRPITRREYDAFQTQALAPQLIEWQMLQAALVLPSVDEVDITHLPAELVAFLEEKVNELSGFEVFE